MTPRRSSLVTSALAAIAGAVALIGPATASAKTLYVDDNGADCPQAANSTVQGAVNAAAAGDTIRVCRGTYREQIVIPIGKDRLQLLSVAQLGATLKPPPGGLGNPEAGPNRPFAIVVVLAERAVVRGFRIEGPLNFEDPGNDCQEFTNASGVAVPRGSALIDLNRMTNVVQDCSVAGGPLIGAGVHAGDIDCAFSDGLCAGARVEVDRNVIGGGTPNGVISEIPASIALVQRNTIVGDGGGGRGVVIDSQSSGPIQGTIRSNNISGMGSAILAIGFGSEGGRPLIRGNHLHDNATGVDVFACNSTEEGEVSSNLIEHNGVGLRMRAGNRWLIQENRFLENSGDGIRIERLDFCDTRRYRLIGNRSLDNGGLDCRDETIGGGTAGTANTWQGNIGRTDSPDVCRAP